MALTVAARTARQSWNFFPAIKKVRITQVTGDAAYPTGGWPLTLAQLGLTALDFVEIENAGGFIFEYDRTNSKLKAYSGVATEAAANLAGLNNLVIRITAYGT